MHGEIVRILSLYFDFPLSYIIPQLLVTHLQLHVSRTRRTNGRSLGTYGKAIPFRRSGSIQRQVLSLSLKGFKFDGLLFNDKPAKTCLHFVTQETCARCIWHIFAIFIANENCTSLPSPHISIEFSSTAVTLHSHCSCREHTWNPNSLSV
jgi:hypothetical protein